MLIMHYFNDKTCFLMLISALNTSRLNKIHPMVMKSMLERSVTTKIEDLTSKTDIF